MIRNIEQSAVPWEIFNFSHQALLCYLQTNIKNVTTCFFKDLSLHKHCVLEFLFSGRLLTVQNVLKIIVRYSYFS